MSDEKLAAAAGAEGDFSFEIDNQGNLLIDGVMTDRQINPLRMNKEDVSETASEDIPPEAGVPPETETVPSPAPAPNEPVPETGMRETPGKMKFKLEVDGEHLEREYDQKELEVTIKKGIKWDRELRKLREKEGEVDAYRNVIKSPHFKNWLDEKIQSGDIETPPPPPKPEPEDIMGYRLRAREPEFNEIRTAMAEWALNLRQDEAVNLENNHRVFNITYDRFKAARGQEQPAPAPDKVVATKEVAEAVLATKEQRKDSARAVTSGTHVDTDPNKAKQQRIAQLQKQSRAGNLGASVELARLLFSDELTGL